MEIIKYAAHCAWLYIKVRNVFLDTSNLVSKITTYNHIVIKANQRLREKNYGDSLIILSVTSRSGRLKNSMTCCECCFPFFYQQ